MYGENIYHPRWCFKRICESVRAFGCESTCVYRASLVLMSEVFDSQEYPQFHREGVSQIGNNSSIFSRKQIDIAPTHNSNLLQYGKDLKSQ
ncbi:hypothetical protein ANN_08309 [Periplaneta americana]|uniref:Uncharacterized protein n=1 Tax=Periplaneta americana TaxID=6978 RepID=A0ABQ8T123_PERAM|nr:hypothetical protein ANN_08309 [Periplaneta americana]